MLITDEEIEIFEKIPDRQLFRVIMHVLDPPCKYEDLSKALYRGAELPPQPRLEYIDCSELSIKFQVSNACRVFQVVDYVISLMPLSILKILRSFIKNTQISNLKI